MKSATTALLLLASSLTIAQTELTISGWQEENKEWLVIQEPAEQELNISLQPFQFEWQQHHDQIRDNLETGRDMTDIVAIDVENVGALIAKPGWINLSERYGAEAIAELFPAYAIAQSRGADGNLYALPYNIGPGSMYYWRDHLKLAGMTIEQVAKDWDSFLEYGRRLKKHGIPLVADATIVAQAIIFTTVEPGEGVYFHADGSPNVINDRFRKALNMAKIIEDEGLSAKVGSWSPEWFEAMNTGSYAVEFSGAWLGGLMSDWLAPDAAGKWGVNNLPDGVYGSWGGTFLAISTQSKNPDKAWELIKWTLTSREHNLERFQQTGSFPSLLETLNDPLFSQPVSYFGGQQAYKQWVEAATRVPAVPRFEGDKIAREVIASVMQHVVFDDMPVEDALQRASDIIEQQMFIFAM